jgi:hypothetical protein
MLKADYYAGADVISCQWQSNCCRHVMRLVGGRNDPQNDRILWCALSRCDARTDVVRWRKLRLGLWRETDVIRCRLQ